MSPTRRGGPFVARDSKTVRNETDPTSLHHDLMRSHSAKDGTKSNGAAQDHPRYQGKKHGTAGKDINFSCVAHCCPVSPVVGRQVF